MQDEKRRIDEAAESLGVAVGKVLRKGKDLVSGFGEGLKEGMRSNEKKEAPETAQETPEQEPEQEDSP